MIHYLWKLVSSIFGVFLAILRPLRRLVCSRQKVSEDLELISIGSGSSATQYSNNQDQNECVSWDVWEDQVKSYTNSENANGHTRELQSRISSHMTNSPYYRKYSESETEPEINFFEDMTPQVTKQPKILVVKKNSEETMHFSGLSNRFSALSDLPIVNSELEAWEDETNAWDTEEISEDLTGQAQETIRETKRLERLERQVEQQKRKQKKDEMRGLKSLVVTKLS
ncbi:receptor-binding cancer antigen expressed on SiSo cells [Biomphalaria pfeifferi]|uniref:Receptor-binding cancer antigen expressed on SiSo cells n=1 Tax=Biomphalaria pfeifferi TaxID=112525 RepID=A0AAD8F8Q3_BIOPF|nr:receptor-binding cancer antigen expressed on SiSo cells [Biomphalaria pfeifferi]